MAVEPKFPVLFRGQRDPLLRAMRIVALAHDLTLIDMVTEAVFEKYGPEINAAQDRILENRKQSKPRKTSNGAD